MKVKIQCIYTLVTSKNLLTAIAKSNKMNRYTKSDLANVSKWKWKVQQSLSVEGTYTSHWNESWKLKFMYVNGARQNVHAYIQSPMLFAWRDISNEWHLGTAFILNLEVTRVTERRCHMACFLGYLLIYVSFIQRQYTSVLRCFYVSYILWKCDLLSSTPKSWQKAFDPIKKDKWKNK